MLPQRKTVRSVSLEKHHSAPRCREEVAKQGLGRREEWGGRCIKRLLFFSLSCSDSLGEVLVGLLFKLN